MTFAELFSALIYFNWGFFHRWLLNWSFYTLHSRNWLLLHKYINFWLYSAYFWKPVDSLWQPLFCESKLNPLAVENSRKKPQINKTRSLPTNSMNSTDLEGLKNAQVKQRRGHSAAKSGAREVRSRLSAAPSCRVSCPGNTSFGIILKCNHASSKSLMRITNNTRSRWELQETGETKSCILKCIQVLILELISVAWRLKKT